MSIVSLFVPETIKVYHSEFNGEINLIRFAQDLRLEVGGLIQSGGVMVSIWSSGIKNLLPSDSNLKKILFLGLGGGTAVRFVCKKFPKAKVTAVEIDPVMIKIAKIHFGVGNLKNLNVVNQDAVKYIRKTRGKYDLILVDCYQGFVTPPGFDDPETLEIMKSKSDHLLINRLYWDDHKIKTDEFVEVMSRHFRIKSVFTASNLVISLS